MNLRSTAITEYVDAALRAVRRNAAWLLRSTSVEVLEDLKGLVGQSPVIGSVFDTVRKVADTPLSIFVVGEAGTRRESVARAIHFLSARRKQPFITVDCGEIAESLLEFELFGYVQGAFARGDKASRGKLELAHGGTLFLSEIDRLSLPIQAKLARVLEERRVYRLGGKRPIQIDVRILASSRLSRHDLATEKRMINEFLDASPTVFVELKPLRERRQDIPMLVQHFLRHHPVAVRKKITRVSTTALCRLMGHSWPGNLRQLENVLERAVVKARSRVLHHVELRDAPAIQRHGTTCDIGTFVPCQPVSEQEKSFPIDDLAWQGGQIENPGRVLKDAPSQAPLKAI